MWLPTQRAAQQWRIEVINNKNDKVERRMRRINQSTKEQVEGTLTETVPQLLLFMGSTTPRVENLIGILSNIVWDMNKEMEAQ